MKFKFNLTVFLLFGILIFSFLNCSNSENTSIQKASVSPKKADSKPDFASLSENLKNFTETGQLPGISAMVLRKGEVIYNEKFGFQNIENQTAVTDKTLFRLASLTKPVTSVGILQLIERGKLNLDDPVEKYLPFFKETLVFETGKQPKNTMTVRQLLNHTSGISSGFEQNRVGDMFREMTKNTKADNLEAFVREIASIPLSAEPGTKFIYSHSTDVLALIIEKVSGKRVDEFLKENLFEPVEMSNTDYVVAEESLEKFATLYVLDEEGNLKSNGENSESSYVKGNFPRGNSGLVSTVEEYVKFATMLLNKGTYKGKQILKKETVEALSVNTLTANQMPVAAGPMSFAGLGFGLGVAVSDGTSPLGKTPGSFGWIGATHTYCFIDPTNEIISIVFSQYGGSKPNPIIFQFNGWVYEDLNQSKS